MLKKRFSHFFGKIGGTMTKKSNGSIVKNSGSNWQMWSISLFGRGEGEVLNLIRKVLDTNIKNYWIATVNPEFIIEASKNADFKAILKKTDMNVVDGVGLVWAREVLSIKYKVLSIKIIKRLLKGLVVGMEILMGKHRDKVVTGADLMNKMCAVAEEMGKTVYFFGGWGNRAEKTANFFKNKYPKLTVAGYRSEDFDFSTNTDILFVARGMRKQEEWIDSNLNKLKTKVVLGVGRSFDYYSGELKRAPKWIRKIGLEWLFSLLMEPRRFKRQLALPKFIWRIIVSK